MATESGPHRSGIKTRFFAFTALATIVAAFGYAGSQGYRAATDSFVAPVILSPDNDVVLANKVKLGELAVERSQILTNLEATASDVAACDEGLARLRAVRTSATNAMEWTAQMNAQRALAAATEAKTLKEQRAFLTNMVAEQKRFANETRTNMFAGLATKAESARELQSLNQLELGLIENTRAQYQANAELEQATFAQRALSRSQGTPMMPEMLAREEQLVRLELEMMRLESEKRLKIGDKRVLQEKLGKIEEIDAQLRGRPIFRAVEQSLDLAFVPYTQIDGVERGADVYDCVWGIFHCRSVGKIAEIVPGEVILPDPWGNQARGQYAVLDLREHESAKAKTLRVRAPAGERGQKPPVAAPEQIVSVK